MRPLISFRLAANAATGYQGAALPASRVRTCALHGVERDEPMAS